MKEHQQNMNGLYLYSLPPELQLPQQNNDLAQDKGKPGVCI